MPTYSYKARDHTGKLVTGEIEGTDVVALKRSISELNLYPISVDLKSAGFSFKSFFAKKPKTQELASLTRQFQIMFSVGTPIDRILTTLANQAHNEGLKAALEQIRKDVAAGMRLALAFGKHPLYFSSIFTSMLEVGQTGGMLDKTLKEMASIFQKEQEIHSKVKSATLYPKIVVFVLAIVMWGMLAFVIPPFQAFYASHNAELPLPTKIIMAFSKLVTTYWYIPIAIFIIGKLGWSRFVKTPRGRSVVGYLSFHLPVFGRLNIMVANARFGHLLAALYRSGIPLTYALNVITQTVNNELFAADLKSLKNGLEQGGSLHKSMEKLPYFQPMVKEACAVGEKTGRLDELLESAAVFYDGDINDMLKNLSTLIEPFMLVLLFGAVLLLALAVYLPIWNLSRVILPH